MFGKIWQKFSVERYFGVGVTVWLFRSINYWIVTFINVTFRQFRGTMNDSWGRSPNLSASFRISTNRKSHNRFRQNIIFFDVYELLREFTKYSPHDYGTKDGAEESGKGARRKKKVFERNELEKVYGVKRSLGRFKKDSKFYIRSLLSIYTCTKGKRRKSFVFMLHSFWTFWGASNFYGDCSVNVTLGKTEKKYCTNFWKISKKLWAALKNYCEKILEEIWKHFGNNFV